MPSTSIPSRRLATATRSRIAAPERMSPGSQRPSPRRPPPPSASAGDAIDPSRREDRVVKLLDARDVSGEREARAHVRRRGADAGLRRVRFGQCAHDRSCQRAWILGWDEEPGSTIDADLGDTSHARGDDRDLGGHGLDQDAAERLLPRRDDDRRGLPEKRTGVGLVPDERGPHVGRARVRLEGGAHRTVPDQDEPHPRQRPLDDTGRLEKHVGTFAVLEASEVDDRALRRRRGRRGGGPGAEHLEVHTVRNDVDLRPRTGAPAKAPGGGGRVRHDGARQPQQETVEPRVPIDDPDVPDDGDPRSPGRESGVQGRTTPVRVDESNAPRGEERAQVADGASAREEGGGPHRGERSEGERDADAAQLDRHAALPGHVDVRSEPPPVEPAHQPEQALFSATNPIREVRHEEDGLRLAHPVRSPARSRTTVRYSSRVALALTAHDQRAVTRSRAAAAMRAAPAGSARTPPSARTSAAASPGGTSLALTPSVRNSRNAPTAVATTGVPRLQAMRSDPLSVTSR